LDKRRITKIKHPQAPPFDNKTEIETFLAKPLLASLGTHNEDGTIHLEPIYYLYDKGEFLLVGLQAKQGCPMLDDIFICM